jgi:hypothetical protein
MFTYRPGQELVGLCASCKRHSSYHLLHLRKEASADVDQCCVELRNARNALNQLNSIEWCEKHFPIQKLKKLLETENSNANSKEQFALVRRDIERFEIYLKQGVQLKFERSIRMMCLIDEIYFRLFYCIRSNLFKSNSTLDPIGFFELSQHSDDAKCEISSLLGQTSNGESNALLQLSLLRWREGQRLFASKTKSADSMKPPQFNKRDAVTMKGANPLTIPLHATWRETMRNW